MKFLEDIRRAAHAATSQLTPWMSDSNLLDEYDREIAKNIRLISQLKEGSRGMVSAKAELAHYRSLRESLLSK